MSCDYGDETAENEAVFITFNLLVKADLKLILFYHGDGMFYKATGKLALPIQWKSQA